MRAETASVSIKELVVRVEPKMYSYLLDDSSEHKKAKAVNKNVATFLFMRIMRIQSKDHRIGTY